MSANTIANSHRGVIRESTHEEAVTLTYLLCYCTSTGVRSFNQQ